MAGPDKAQVPLVSYTVVQSMPLTKTENWVTVSMTPARPINGFHGTTIEFQVEKKEAYKHIAERVRWKAEQQTGLPYAIEDVKEQT